MKYGKYLVCT